MDTQTIQIVVAVVSVITTLVIIAIAIWNAWNQHIQTKRQNKRIIELLEVEVELLKEIRDSVRRDKE